MFPIGRLHFWNELEAIKVADISVLVCRTLQKL